MKNTANLTIISICTDCDACGEIAICDTAEGHGTICSGCGGLFGKPEAVHALLSNHTGERIEFAVHGERIVVKGDDRTVSMLREKARQIWRRLCADDDFRQVDASTGYFRAVYGF